MIITDRSNKQNLNSESMGKKVFQLKINSDARKLEYSSWDTNA